MTREQLVSQSLVSWLAGALRTDSDVAREALPAMDVAYFLRALVAVPGFEPQNYSLVLAGFGVDQTRLRELAEDAGLTTLRGLADDLYTAAAWRNDRANNPNIIALARGWHPGVSTLKHFEAARSRDLVQALLEWAVASNRFCANGAQRELIEVLRRTESLADIQSLESVTSFLAAWSVARAGNQNDAPRIALPHLGLLADPALFTDVNKLEPRLIHNRDTTRQIIDTSAYQIRTLRKRITAKYRNDLTLRDRLVGALDRIDALRLTASVDRLSNLTLAEAAEAWRPPPDAEPQPPDDVVEPPPPPPPPPPPDDDDDLDLDDAAETAGDALLDNRQEDLTDLLAGLEEAVRDAMNNGRTSAEGEVEVGDQTFQLDFPIDQRFLDWVHSFCSQEHWGGFIETRESALPKALEQYAASSHVFLQPDQIAPLDDRVLSMDQLLGDWDRDLGRKGIATNLQAVWRQFVAMRSEILAELDSLLHFPLNWLSGRPAAAELVDRYLRTASELYGGVQRHYRDMQDVDEGWARAVLEGLLALDVVQVRCELDAGRVSTKAVLLPTHPLHLWRYQRLVSVLRGLGDSLEDEDRKAVLDQCRRPDQFLSVLFVGSLPAKRAQAPHLLPISNDLNGLATFENLQNAYNGLDGMLTLSYALDRFAVMHRNHTSPLRVAIVNPPEATALVAALTKLLSDRRVATVAALRMELFATPATSVRMRAAKALEFSGKQQEIIEDKLTSGRLELRVHEEPVALEQLVTRFRAEPFHFVMIFDEAGVNIRRSGMGAPLPMSPFCVRKSIRYEERRNVLRLVPTTDDPPFSEFMQLINEAETGQRDSTPHTWADAENLRQIFDAVLQGDAPGAHWLALADRALPSESGMASVRLLMRREGQRDVLLVTRDYRRLAHLVRPAFDRCNLTMSSTQLERLLEEGVNLVGAGLLDLIKHDGTADPGRVLGLAGMLLAARDYRIRHPQSLIVSVDHEVARLWLRLGNRGERCDLLCLRREADQFVVETLEVKTTFSQGGNDDPALIEHAQQQLATTLDAVAQGLPIDASGGVLSAPRCEMLKEVLVRGCLSRSVPADLRSQWSVWLKQLFRQEGDALATQLCGEVVRICIGSNEPAAQRELATQPHLIALRLLSEQDVQRLIEWTGGGNPPPSEPPPPAPPVDPAPPSSPSTATSATPSEVSRVLNRETPSVAPAAPSESAAPQPAAATVPTGDWPPPVNALGMIGQAEVVRQLLNQIQYARDFGERFKDKLLVGSAGVGKSSLARAIAVQLLHEEPILFNGADLQKPRMLIERLQQCGKVPDDPQQRVQIARCLIFIDEVHAVHVSVVTVLLGALDDRRLTTIDNVDYDFGNVILIMATTNAGKLSEAFRSRPDKVLLRNYTLNELAGIVWKHGCDLLDGFDLPQEVCIEIAARMRCRPRDAVRMLGQLVPHLHAQVREAGEQPSRHRIGERMTLAHVAEFFQQQGIDANGLDDNARNYLLYLQRNGATAEDRLKQVLGVPDKQDFIEIDEYLVRLGLVTISGGRALTPAGRRYLQVPVDLRSRIARQMN